MPSIDAFLAHAQAVAAEARSRFTRGNRSLKVFSHIDADGLSAAGIMGTVLRRAGWPFQLRILRQVNRQNVEEIHQTSSPSKHGLVFTDFGTGQKALLREFLADFDVLICDHHQPAANDPDLGSTLDRPAAPAPDAKFMEINPHYFGLDGGEELSGSGAAYVFGKALDARNEDLAALALVGAIGDRQDKGENFEFQGFNRRIFEEARAQGLMEQLDGIRVFGRETKPLGQALAYSSGLFLPGFSGNEDACLGFFQRIDIPLSKPDGDARTFADLTDEEVRRVTSNLMSLALVEWNVDPGQLKDLIGAVYILSREPPGTELHDAREFAFLLNSCGRLGYQGLGVAIGMGDRGESFTRALEVIAQYRQTLSRAIESVTSQQLLQQKPNLQYFLGGSDIAETIVGTVCSMLLSHPSTTEKVIVGLAESEDPTLYKVSCRAPQPLIHDETTNPGGVNLAEVMHAASDHFQLENPAGGHAAASGAYIPTSISAEFLDFVDEYIEKVLSASPPGD